MRRRVLVAAVSAVVLATSIPPGVTRAESRQPVERRISIGGISGTPFDIAITDQGRGRPVVFLHGLGASSYMWRRILPGMPAGHRLVTIDLKGFGRSDKPIDFRYAIEDHAAAVEAVLAALNLRDVTLVGHSFGGAVALLVATRDADRARPRLDHLVLVDSPAYPQRPTAAVRFLRKPLAAYIGLALLPPEKMVVGALRGDGGLPAGLTRDDIAAYAAPLAERGARHALIETAIGLEPVNFAEVVRSYRRLDIPALLVWCRDDPVVPTAVGKRLSRELPLAELRIIDGCRHVPPEETPGALVRILRRFLERVDMKS